MWAEVMMPSSICAEPMAASPIYLSNEGVSLLENTAHLGLPIPEKLKDILSQLHGREVIVHFRNGMEIEA